jgi:thermostable 8-oxoguanine DNA glycosylase|tara:strand:- start:14626 stop:15210 length:585 start_codon:yes stop_codon:yes gene_type:complete
MIDPKKVTDYGRNETQLQEFLLYCVCVAGKKSEIETRKLDKFLSGASPFKLIRKLLKSSSVIWKDGLMEHLSKNKVAPYKQRYNSFKDAVTLLPDNLSEVTLDRLQQVRGISTKTSRFFLTHSREDFDEPVLDTHILRYLKDVGHDVPSSTPQNPNVYGKVASLFKKEADLAEMSVTDFDLKVWTEYSYGLTKV